MKPRMACPPSDLAGAPSSSGEEPPECGGAELEIWLHAARWPRRVGVNAGSSPALRVCCGGLLREGTSKKRNVFSLDDAWKTL